MDTLQALSISDVEAARPIIRRYLAPAPLIRSHALERVLGLAPDRRVWLKDYGWTPVGSFKVMGALYWMHCHAERIGSSPVVAHSSGNFASGLAYAGKQYGKRVIVVMPTTAPRVKVNLTRSFGAEIRTFDLATDHLTGQRDRLTREINEQEQAVPAHPYDDPAVICGNAVGGLEIAAALAAEGRQLSHFFSAVSGGGLMAGHALALAHHYPMAQIIGVEPAGADDFRQSLQASLRTRIEHPQSICDGLLSYDVGEYNWPILQKTVSSVVTPSDLEVKQAMAWLYQQHGLRVEPSGAITIAALLRREISIDGHGDIVLLISGRNVDEVLFGQCLQEATSDPSQQTN